MAKAEKKVKKPSTATHPKVNWSVIFKPRFLAVFFVFVFSVSLVYSGHFHNPFHFDDDHTIVSNKWIKHLDSFPKFFTDASTTSSLPRNQAYRPGVTLLHAIDYHLSIDTTSAAAKATLDSAKTPAARAEIIRGMLVPKPYYFHVHIFIGFLLSGILLFFVLLHIFNSANPEGKFNEWLALFGMGLFWLHTANAETINYISARSDSASTFWILLTFLVYFYSNISRRFHLYLLPMIVGFFIKEPAIMFAPLMLMFISLFETDKKPLMKFWFPVATAFVTALILFKISRSYTPTTWDAGGTDPVHYLLTEAFVIVHYFVSFFFPVNLSADTDWQAVTRFLDDKVIIGGFFILFLLYLVVRCWKKREWRPVSFGITWFLVALAPTSSIFPFAEVLNDHRTYFPYIGLIIAVVCTIGNLLEKYLDRNKKLPQLFAGAAFIILFIHGVGTYERCIVWSSGDNLWHDCVIKSPGNGRAWMMYGMTLSDRGLMATTKTPDSSKYWYDSAQVCYNKSKYFLPNYSYLYINLGVLQQRQGNLKEAEADYLYSVQLDPGNSEPYFYIGDLYRLEGKTSEAFDYAKRGLNVSPGNEKLISLYSEVQGFDPSLQYFSLKKKIGDGTANSNDYTNLGLYYYQTFKYDSCILASQKAVSLDSGNYNAWNNICAANNVLGNYVVAGVAGTKAKSIRLDFPNADANLFEANRCLHVMDSLTKKLPAKPTIADYIDLSLSYYNEMMYMKCVEAANAALQLDPTNAIAYNNICSAYNKLSMFDKAVAAGELAVKYDKGQLGAMAKNNLIAAQSGLARNGK